MNGCFKQYKYAIFKTFEEFSSLATSMDNLIKTLKYSRVFGEFECFRHPFTGSHDPGTPKNKEKIENKSKHSFIGRGSGETFMSTPESTLEVDPQSVNSFKSVLVSCPK